MTSPIDQENRVISLFPLPSSVFFPSTKLPLHIFEPRYRQMVEHSIETGQWIGLVLLSPGWEEGYHGSPAVNLIGCAGAISRHERLGEGKFNILLEGEIRFKIIDEIKEREFRQAKVMVLPDKEKDISRENPRFKKICKDYLDYMELQPKSNKKRKEIKWDPDLPVGQSLNRLAYSMPLSVEEKQGFLQECDVSVRMTKIEGFLALHMQILKMSKTIHQGRINVDLN